MQRFERPVCDIRYARSATAAGSQTVLSTSRLAPWADTTPSLTSPASVPMTTYARALVTSFDCGGFLQTVSPGMGAVKLSCSPIL